MARASILSISIIAIYFHFKYSEKAVAYGPTILTTTGIFATFIGIAAGLSKFDTANIQASVPDLLSGLKTAFWGSVFGVGWALSLKFRHYIFGVKSASGTAMAGEPTVACNETSGQFQLNIMVRGGDNPIARDLSVCRHCLEGMPYKNYSRASSPAVKQKAVDSFSRADFFEQYPKSCLDEYPKHDWKTAPINAYPPGFGEVSRHYRQLAGFRCQEASCGVDLSAREHRWFLETHHKNGQKDDNSAANLIPLCVYCHANQFQHSQVKNTPKYKKFLAIRLQLLQLQRAKSNHS